MGFRHLWYSWSLLRPCLRRSILRLLSFYFRWTAARWDPGGWRCQPFYFRWTAARWDLGGWQCQPFYFWWTAARWDPGGWRCQPRRVRRTCSSMTSFFLVLDARGGENICLPHLSICYLCMDLGLVSWSISLVDFYLYFGLVWLYIVMNYVWFLVGT